MGALDQLQGEQGILERARSNSRIVVAIAAAAILLLAWIGWAIYVTSSKGATAGLGVVIAWPAMLAALALISLPFIGGYLLVRRLSNGEDPAATAESDAEEERDLDAEDSDEEVEEESEDSGEDDESEEEPDDDSEPDPEAKAAKS